MRTGCRSSSFAQISGLQIRCRSPCEQQTGLVAGSKTLRLHAEEDG